MDATTQDLTPKAQETRQHILDTALGLFQAQGYDKTTMREIAAAADCSLGLAYRYFDGKEALVLALYQQMSALTIAQIADLPPASVAERFHHVMTARLRQAVRYRESLGALFGATLNPASSVNLLGERAAGARSQARRAFVSLVSGAEDAPSAGQIEDLAVLLYSAHFGVLLFWLYDRTPGQRATADLLDLMRDVLRLGHWVATLPLTAPLLARLARIVGAVFGE